MALVDDVLNAGNIVTGLLIGVGALIVGPLIRTALKPIAKAAIEGGLIAYREAGRLYNDATGEELADHYGAQKPSRAPDPTVPLPAAAQSR
jgi:hypothetical protein